MNLSDNPKTWCKPHHFHSVFAQHYRNGTLHEDVCCHCGFTVRSFLPLLHRPVPKPCGSFKPDRHAFGTVDGDYKGGIGAITIGYSHSELQDAPSELKMIKEEIVEYVLDGDDFNWLEAIARIRAWREDAQAAREET